MCLFVRMNLDSHFANRDVFIGCCESQDGSGQWSSNVSLHHSHVEGLFRRRPRGTTCKASGLAGLHSSRFPDGVDAAALRTTRLWQSATLTLQWVSIIKAYFWGRQGPHRRWNPSKTLFSMGDSAVAWLHYQEHVASLLGGRKQWRCSPHQLHVLAREWLLITTCWPRLVTWPQWKVVGSPSGGDAICAWKERRLSCG